MFPAGALAAGTVARNVPSNVRYLTDLLIANFTLRGHDQPNAFWRLSSRDVATLADLTRRLSLEPSSSSGQVAVTAKWRSFSFGEPGARMLLYLSVFYSTSRPEWAQFRMLCYSADVAASTLKLLGSQIAPGLHLVHTHASSS